MSVMPRRGRGFVEAPCDMGRIETREPVWESWSPQVGDYVRVQPGPECRYGHDRLIAGRYGRVEVVDREYDSLTGWIEATTADDGTVNMEEAVTNALASRGHYYYVNDALGGPRTALLDGQFAALELTPVPEAEARAAIEALRAEMAALSPDERFLWRLGNLMGTDVVDAIRKDAARRVGDEP